jgi:arylsulfatase A-like enzyme
VETPVAIDDVVVFPEPLRLVPGTRWQEHGQDRWGFQNRASLVAWVRASPAGEPLVVRLRPNRLTREHHFAFEWDGQALSEAEVARAEDGELTVTVAAERLAPGYHELTLDRDYQRDAKAVRNRARNVFTRVAYRCGAHQETLAVDQLARHQVLARFLQFRVLGTDKEQRGGVLFMGPGRHALALPAAARGVLSLEPQNFSPAPALFRAGDAAVTVAPGERADLRVELAGGELRLAVEGEAHGAYLWGIPRLAAPATAERPPIVLVTLDTTRRDALGLFNGLADATPHVDRLAAEATVYERAFSTAPWTLPSHASIFTGLYPSRHGAGVSRPYLGEAATLAGLLRRQGYLTAGFSSGDLSSSRFGLARGFHYYRDPDRFETPGGDLAGYLDAFLDAYGDHRRLFLFANYFDPHALYQAPAAWEEKFGVPAFRDKLRGEPVWDDLFAGKMAAWRQLVEGEAEIPRQAVTYLRTAYLAEVAYADHLLGRLFARLRELGLYDPALIVVTADHGELLGEHGFVSHGARLDPELVEIPLIVKWPGQRQGRRERHLTSLVDLFPTILRAAGVEPPPSDGRPLAPEGRDDGQTHPFVLLEEHESVVHPLPKYMKIASHLFGVQRPDFRQLVWNDGQTCARRNGRWRAERCATKLADVLAAIRAQLGPVTTDDGDAVVADDVRESLEALGYM